MNILFRTLAILLTVATIQQNASAQVHAQINALARAPLALRLAPEFSLFQAPALFTDQQKATSEEKAMPKSIEHCAKKERTGAVLAVIGGVFLATGAAFIVSNSHRAADQDALLGFAGGAVLAGAGLGIGIPGLHLATKYHRKRMEALHAGQ